MHQQISPDGEVAVLREGSGAANVEGSYFRFVLRKQGLTTASALDLLSKTARVRFHEFRFSGLKVFARYPLPITVHGHSACITSLDTR
jgi:hypothetical protein